MIDWGGKKVGLVQQTIADLEQRVAALSARLAETEHLLAASRDHLNDAMERFDSQSAQLGDAKQRIEALVSVVAGQASKIEQLNERQERHKELDSRVRADLARFERQVAIDFSELRQTSLALAERLMGAARENTSAGPQ